jgi:hypothetical protein
MSTVPQGYALVPIVPTAAMMVAWNDAQFRDGEDDKPNVRQGWAAMLAAAPLPSHITVHKTTAQGKTEAGIGYASPQVQGGEAVAWRWWDGRGWLYAERPPVGAEKYQPLYLAPQRAPGVDAQTFWDIVCAWTWKHRGWSPALVVADELRAALTSVGEA